MPNEFLRGLGKHYVEAKDVTDRKQCLSALKAFSTNHLDTSQANLKSSSAIEEHRYPHNIKVWNNFAAQDAFISHDQKVKNDFKRMLPNKFDLCESITDNRIYNFAFRGRNEKNALGKSNAHHGVGYLVHHEVCKQVTQWL